MQLKRRNKQRSCIGVSHLAGELVHVLHIVGARPNFMKVAPVLNALRGRENVA